MAAERLSKLQKFILTAAYKKTVLREPLPVKVWQFEEYTKDIREFATIDKDNGGTMVIYEENKYKQLYDALYYSALYESDILLNFYNLFTTSENYGYIGGSNKEKTALRRSLNTLYERGYINQYWQWVQNAGSLKETCYFAGQSIPLYDASYTSRAIITLTDKGKETAANFLKL